MTTMAGAEQEREASRASRVSSSELDDVPPLAERLRKLADQQVTPMAVLGGMFTVLAGVYASGNSLFTARVLPIWIIFVASVAWVLASHRLTIRLFVLWRARRRDRDRPAPRDWDARAERRNRLLPDVLTLTRPGLGVAVAVLLIQGDVVIAFWVFFVGQVNDLLDGLLARDLTTNRSDYGERFDAVSDLLFHLACSVGLVAYSLRYDQLWVTVVIAGGIVVWVVPRLGMFEPGSVLAKLLSGIIRGVLLGILLLLLPAESRVPALVASGYFAAVGLWYQALVTGRELRQAQRPRQRWAELPDSRS